MANKYTKNPDAYYGEILPSIRRLFGGAIRNLITKKGAGADIAGPLSFTKMKARHTMQVYWEGIAIYNALNELALTDPDGRVLVSESNILGDITNAQAAELVKKYSQELEFALMGHDWGRALEHDADGKPVGRDHADLSYEIAPEFTKNKIVQIAILNHKYNNAATMHQKLTIRDEKDPNAAQAYDDFHTLNDEQRCAVVLLSLIVRDADKFGNWRAFAEQGINRQVVKTNIIDKDECRVAAGEITADQKRFRDTVSLSDYVMGQVRQWKPVNYGLYTNFSDVQVAHMMWATDTGLTSTAVSVSSGGLTQGLIDYLMETAVYDTSEKLKDLKQSEAARQEFNKLLSQVQEVFDTLKQHGWIANDKQFDPSVWKDKLDQRIKGTETRVLTFDGLNMYEKKSNTR